MIDQINSQPVYTVHDFLEGYKLSPQKILVLGGPAPFFAQKIEDLYQIDTLAVPNSPVANAVGAALARTTCEVSLYADTEQGIVTAHEEDFAEPISKTFSEDDLMETAYTLLREKALNSGADPETWKKWRWWNSRNSTSSGIFRPGAKSSAPRCNSNPA